MCLCFCMCLSLCVHVYVCVCVRMHVCICVYFCTCVCVWCVANSPLALHSPADTAPRTQDGKTDAGCGCLQSIYSVASLGTQRQTGSHTQHSETVIGKQNHLVPKANTIPYITQCNARCGVKQGPKGFNIPSPHSQR